MTGVQRDAIEKLYFEMHDFLLSYAISSTKNMNLAEEAVQETYRIACMKSDALLSSNNPQGWLINTLKNVIKNLKRKQDGTNRLLMAYTAAYGNNRIAFSEDKLKMEIEYEDIAGTEEFRLIKEMVVERRSHLEMAEARGISVDACKKRVQRAKEFLRNKIMVSPLGDE